MKKVNEKTYSYLGILLGYHIFQNTKFSSEKIWLAETVEFAKLDGSRQYLDQPNPNVSTITIEVLTRA
jgi:hypothetical protein